MSATKQRSSSTVKPLDASHSSPEQHGEEAVYAAISKSLLEGKLRPGTPLRERYLAELFGTTRGAVRKVLLRLAHEGRLETIPHRGAFVPRPTDADVRQVYDLRKAVETGMVTLLASRITVQQLAHLQAHVGWEQEAQCENQRAESVRLAGGFHVQLVQALDNKELTAIIERLIERTQMYVALFESAVDARCAPTEHEAIVEALAVKDGPRAAAAMLQHLQQIEERVIKHMGVQAPPDLGDILRAAL